MRRKEMGRRTTLLSGANDLHNVQLAVDCNNIVNSYMATPDATVAANKRQNNRVLFLQSVSLFTFVYTSTASP